jgi:AcrR family transcriptional regulator
MEPRIMQPRQDAKPSDPAVALLEATEACLKRHGLAGLSTRQVAEQAGMPLSQIHYHFGSKRKLLLALLAHQNLKLLARQERMYAQPMPLSQRWMQACDYLEEDLASGYVRVLQEMLAASWSDEEIAVEVRRLLGGWYELLERVAGEAAQRLGGLGPFTAAEAAALAGSLFIGAESLILLGFDAKRQPIRAALRKVGELIRLAEDGSNGGDQDESEAS